MRKTFAIFLLMTLVLATSLVAASDLNVDVYEVRFDGLDIENQVSVAAGEAGELIPIDVYFTADENASDVEVSAWIQGDRSNSAERDFADLIEDKSYHARLGLILTDDIDPEEELTLYVRIETDAGNWEEAYTIGLQRKPYVADLLFVEFDSQAKAGSSVPVDVVVKNLGRHELEDLIVSVRIPELGVSKRAYFGDLTPVDSCDHEDEDDCDKEDAEERRLYLKIPTNANPGVYEVEVITYNDDAESYVRSNIEIVGAEDESTVVVPVTSKEFDVGQVVEYDLLIVNSGSNIAVYEIVPEVTEGLMVSADKTVVTVRAGSSEVVNLKVKASEKGTYSFAVNVNSENDLVQRVVMNATVMPSSFGGSNVAILTIVLVIIFIVLLIVLIVLLTRRPERMEELEESYY